MQHQTCDAMRCDAMRHVQRAERGNSLGMQHTTRGRQHAPRHSAHRHGDGRVGADEVGLARPRHDEQQNQNARLSALRPTQRRPTLATCNCAESRDVQRTTRRMRRTHSTVRNAATRNGATCNAATRNAATCNAATRNGATRNGATCNAATRNGATWNGASCNGATRNGATRNGATRNGATRNGATRNVKRGCKTLEIVPHHRGSRRSSMHRTGCCSAFRVLTKPFKGTDSAV